MILLYFQVSFSDYPVLFLKTVIKILGSYTEGQNTHDWSFNNENPTVLVPPDIINPELIVNSEVR